MRNLMFSFLLESTDLKIINIVDLLHAAYFYESFNETYKELTNETFIYKNLHCTDIY